MNNNFHPPILRAIRFVIGFLLMSFTGYGQVWPVEVFPSINMPYPACLADYANDQPSTQRMQLSLLLRDITVSHRQVRLKVYIQGGGMSIQGSDNTEGTPAIYLDGGSLYRMDNSQLAPFFRFGNLMGISPDQYASTLPSGVYTIGFEVYDFNTNQRLSLRQNAYLQIILNDPPLLNLPAKGNEVSSRLPQSVVFNWTPRQMGAFVSEYELSLVEIWDEGVSPEAAFLSSPPIYQETVRATSLYYGPAQPSLVPGRRYAWRVQAKTREGMSYVHTYKNDGYSEISWFVYESPLIAPENLKARFTGEHAALFEWDGQPNYTGYRFEIRPVGTDKWYSWEVTAQEFESPNLTPGRNYEWRVTGIKANNNSAMSETVQYRQPATEPEPYKNCGDRTPLPPITNHTPLQQLLVGDKFTANGSPMTVEAITSANGGVFCGQGWTVLPFLGNYKIAVRFVDVMINTDYQLISGYAETITDKQKKGIVDVDQAIKTIKDGIKGVSEGGADAGNEATAYTSSNITVAMDLSEVKKVDYDTKTGKLTISSNGATQSYTVDNKPAAKDQPVVVADSSGKLYSIDQKTGTVTPMGTPESPAGLSEEKGKSIVVTFANAPGDATAFCAFDPVYDGAFNDKMEILEMADGQKYRVPAKLMIAGGGTGQVIATVKFTGKFDSKKVIFRTFTGEEWPSELNSDKQSYTVTVKPGSTSGATDLLALYQPKGSDKPELVGKLKIYTYNAVNKEVVLVPVEKATIPDGLADELARIYKPYGVNLTVSKALDPLYEIWWDTDGDHLLDATGTSRLSRYSDEMRRMNSAYRLDRAQKFKKEALYLFVLAGAKTDDGLPLLGDMPRGKQFGYIFTKSNPNPATTAAHELGHGIFRLAHIFDDYGYPQGKTDNLMDYPSTSSGQAGGKELVKYQWDILHDTGIAGWLDDAQEGQSMIAYSNAIEAIRNANLLQNSTLTLSSKWKANETISLKLDAPSTAQTPVISTIVKSGSTIIPNQYQLDYLPATKEMKVSFVENSTDKAVALSFTIPETMLDEFIKYLNISDLNKLDIEVDGATKVGDQWVAFISEIPEMPKLKVKITSSWKVPLELDYALTYSLKYSYDGDYTFTDDPISKEKLTSTTKEIAIDWGNKIQGGDLTIKWKHGLASGTKIVLIRGKNPDSQLIQQYGNSIGASSYWFYWKLTMAESSMKQFWFNGDYKPIKASDNGAQADRSDQLGLPYWGGPRGFGLNQLDHWTANGINKVCSSVQRWNWKENLKGGLEVLREKIGTLNQIKAGHKETLQKWYDLNPDDIVPDDLKIIAGEGENQVVPSIKEGNETFAVTPKAGEHDIYDAVLIKLFNGGNYYYQIIEPKEQNGVKQKPYRVINRTNPKSKNYVEDVCKQSVN